jgi:NADPH-dependent 2,4-dienoyl-CoA reductase/sulfur reductase-like enzyme
VPVEDVALPHPSKLDAMWLLGHPATGLDLKGKRVRLADGQEVEFDRLLIATGVRARPWPNPAEAELDGVFVLRTRPNPAEAELDGVFVLRTRDDADRLRQRLAAGTGRVLVIGAGFTGSEIASACRGLGLAGTAAEAGAAALVGALGGVLGAIAADLQREHGVDLRCGVEVTRLEADAHGRVCRAPLSDGSRLDVDVVVAALGTVRNPEWLEGSGLAAGPWGLARDAGCPGLASAACQAIWRR